MAERPSPPSPTGPEPAPAPIRELAVEILPLVGLGLTGEQAEFGFFGEAFGGLRWQQYAALAVGLGGGALNAKHHVLLLSAVPQFRPLPLELPVDIAIGVPFGYVNYSHEAIELDGNEPVALNRAENGFHVGALLSVMVETNDWLAMGPTLHFDRFIADRGSSFFVVALSGRYTHWLESDGR